MVDHMADNIHTWEVPVTQTEFVLSLPRTTKRDHFIASALSGFMSGRTGYRDTDVCYYAKVILDLVDAIIAEDEKRTNAKINRT